MLEKFDLAETIVHEINEIVWMEDVSYMDAVLIYCERNDADVESIGEFIRKIPILSSKIEEEAENLNFLKRTSRLPV